MSTPSPPVEAPSIEAELRIFLQNLESGEWKRYRPRGRSLLERLECLVRGSRHGPGRGSSP